MSTLDCVPTNSIMKKKKRPSLVGGKFDAMLQVIMIGERMFSMIFHDLIFFDFNLGKIRLFWIFLYKFSLESKIQYPFIFFQSDL